MFFVETNIQTLTKILKQVYSEENDVSEVIEHSIVEEGPDNGDPPIDCQRVYEKSELFKFSV